MASGRTVRFWAVVFLGVFFLISLGARPSTAATPKKGGTLVIGTEKDPQGMDHQKDMAIQGITINPQILEGLLDIDDEGNAIPSLAERMPEQPDLATYIFTLRKGVKFHNGAEFDARDVKFNFDRLRNKEVSHYWQGYADKFKNIEILDPYKIKITLNAPDIAFLDFLAKMPELRIAVRGSEGTIKHPIGTGAFKFKEWVKDERLVLVRNENYWRKGLPYLDQIIYKPFPEPTTRVINLKTGRLDLMHGVSAKDALELKKESQFKVLGRTGGETIYLHFNTTKPPFDQKKVRQAVLYAIDRQVLAESVFLGMAEVSQDMFPSWFFAHDPSVKSYPYHPEKARQLLKEAGYSESRPLSFSIMATNEPKFVDQMVIIQSQLAKVGAKVTLTPVEKSYRVDAQHNRKGRDYEALMTGGSDDMTEFQWTQRTFGAKSYFNYQAYNNERSGKKGAQNSEAERLIQTLLKTPDREQRRRIYRDLQKLVLDDAPAFYLLFFQNIIAMKDSVKNHKVLTRNTIPLREVWIEK